MITPEIYVNFAAYNYKGEISLSGYALPGNTFTFVADLSGAEVPVSTSNITWDLGDGTRTADISPTHTYEWPGVYTVSIVVYKSDGDAAYSTVRKTLSVFDVLDNSLYATATAAHFLVPAGQYSPFTIYRRNSWQTYSALSATGYTINLYVSGSWDPVVDLTLYNSDAWSHFRRNTFFFEKVEGQAATEYIPISSIATTADKIYVKLNAVSAYDVCLSTDTGAVFAGTSGIAVTYFTSHTPRDFLADVGYEYITTFGDDLLVSFNSDTIVSYNTTTTPVSTISAVFTPAIIFCSLDNRKLQDQFTYITNFFKYNTPDLGYLNTKPATLPVGITYNQATQLSFSTNGIDTQGDALLSSFAIPTVSWQRTNIPFIIKLKDRNNFSTLAYPLLSSNVVNMTASGSFYNMNISLMSNSTPVPGVTFYTDFLDTLPGNAGGYFKGYFNCPVSALNCTLSAQVTVSNPQHFDSSMVYVSANNQLITGTSNTFNIYPSAGYYNIVKQNEDFDMAAFFNTLKLPEYLVDKGILFDTFLGSIVGNVDSDPTSIGKTIYEKIANFSSNTVDVDTANVQSLLSICAQHGVDTGESNVEFPPQLRRIVDMVSIKRSKLFGNQLQNGANFNAQTRSLLLSTTNIGNMLDINTGTFSLSESLVAHELFSDTYKVVKLPALSGYTGSSVFKLSSYSPNWNLGLISYDTISGTDIGNYYEFYRYTSSGTKDVVDSVINWKDSTLTLSFYNSGYNHWTDDGGVVDNLLNYEITRGLLLFE